MVNIGLIIQDRKFK